ncbi:zinc finger CCCH domain-containing protein 32-like isoform X2 [Telopea speciosissima]|uniref:zinc finger CCCH domain-containing protein 32-like isoform X2 n=1 Tax=Telopea speciosissima TaxID=54955 RepID=UPI001CC78CB1|nr:zinc finger CCCH domain-containing protein 32-like isoform X2 [Telopea speciosissima]
MEQYGRNPSVEGNTPDPTVEWSSPGAETGLEESMWQLGLGSSRELYPERPGEPDCVYYMRTGSCGYGARCRYNHPRDRITVVGSVRPFGGEYPERAGQPACQYYLKTGTCKFGASCKYHHPRHGGGSVSPVSLNYYGFPLRPGEKECSYYMKTGQCKFGVTCKFHHPQPAGVSVPASASPFYPTVQSPSVPTPQFGGVATNWQVARPPLLHGSYVQGAYGPVLLPPGMVPVPTWGPYPGPVSPVASPTAQPTVGAGPFYGVTQLSPSAPVYPGPYQMLPSSAGPSSSSQKEHTYPERPGQPECQYYMRTGECKFGSTCRYHHPQEWISPRTNCILSPIGLPLRPGAPPCTHYAQNGVCKFGPTCKFDHPMGTLSYSPSASSLADMPVAPYPVGSSLATLAPSSSSSELRPEFVSGSNRDSFSTRIPSSENTSSGSVGSIFSKGRSIPHSSVQQSGQSYGPRSGSSSTGQSGEARSSS